MNRGFVLFICVRFYSSLLWVYPQSFRMEYEDLMIQLFRDMCRDAIQQRGCLGLWEVWFLALTELGATAQEQHWFIGNFYHGKPIPHVVLQGIIAMLLLVGGWLYLSWQL